MNRPTVLDWLGKALGKDGREGHALDLQAFERRFAQRYGQFLKDSVNPGTAERDATLTPIPRKLLKEAARIGLSNLAMPRQLGGGGRSLLEWGLTLEQLAYSCDDVAFPLLVSLYTSVGSAIYQSGNKALIEKYVRPMVTGDRFVSFAYSEERDAFNLGSYAEEARGGYILNGRKVIVTGGMVADAFMTYARRASGDICVFIVDCDDQGVERTPVDTMGWHSAGLASLEFKEVRVPQERVLQAADGLSHVQRFLNQRRILTSSGAVGYMRAIAEKCLEFLTTTTRYRMLLSDMQLVQAKLGRTFAAIETSRVVTHEGLKRLDAGAYNQEWDPYFSAAKFYVTEQAVALGQTILHLTGGRGYESKYGFERYVRNISGMIAGAGSQDVLEVDLGVWYASTWEQERMRRNKS